MNLFKLNRIVDALGSAATPNNQRNRALFFRPLQLFLTALAALLAMALGTVNAVAADGTWINATKGTQDYETTTNWTGSPGIVADGAGATGTFQVAPSGGNQIIRLNGNSRTLGTMLLQTNSRSQTISANSNETLTFDNNGSTAQLTRNTSGNNTYFYLPILLNSSLNISNNDTGNRTLNFQTGQGTGAAHSATFTNNTANALTITNNGTGGTGAGVLFDNIISDGTKGGTISLVQSSATSFSSLDVANTYSGSTTLTSGTLNLANANAIQNSTLMMNGGTLLMSGGTAFNFGGLSASKSGAGYDIGLTNSAGTAVALTVGANGLNTTYAGVLSGSGSLTKIGAGMLTLSAANTYSGPTNVNGGVLAVGASNALSQSSDMSVGYQGTAGTLDVTGASGQTVKSISIGAQGALNVTTTNPLTSLGTASFDPASTINISGAITTLPELLISYAGSTPGAFGTVNYFNGISWGSLPAAYSLQYSGGSVEIVAAAAASPSVWKAAVDGNWSDGTKWTGGEPNATSAGAIVKSPTNAAVTITLDLPKTIGSLELGNSDSATLGYTIRGSGANSLTLNNSTSAATIVVDDGAHVIDATVNLTNGLDISGSGKLTFSGSITGVGPLTMSGTGGTLLLSGTGNYNNGTNVLAGILAVTTSTALPDNQSLTVGAGGTLIFDPSFSFSPIIASPLSPQATNSPVNPVPEPGALALLLAGLVVGCGAWRRRKK